MKHVRLWTVGVVFVLLVRQTTFVFPNVREMETAEFYNIDHRIQQQTMLEASLAYHRNNATLQSTDHSPQNSSFNMKTTASIPRKENDNKRIRQKQLQQTEITIQLSPESDPRLAPEQWYASLLDPWNAVQQTLCVEKSRFCNLNPHDLSNDDWHLRLLFMGMYLHQHLPTKRAMQRRILKQKDREQTNHYSSRSTIEYQCDPDTKYLVASLPMSGMGATFRNGAVPALLAGLATGRVVLFVNDKPYGPEQMQYYDWTLASKEECPRGDYTCYFLPMSPCVLTDDEIQQGKIIEDLPYNAIKEVMDHGHKYDDERVVVMDAESMPLEPNPVSERRIRQRIYDLIQSNIISNNNHTHHQPPQHVFQRVLLMPYRLYDRKMKRNNVTHSKNTYGLKIDHATSTLHQAALLYILRPHWQLRQLIEADFSSAFPNDFDPEWSFGVPIRGKTFANEQKRCELRFLK